MYEEITTLLWIGAALGAVFFGYYLCLLPPRVFLRHERWMTAEELCAATPEKAWCRFVPIAAWLIGFPTYLLVFAIVGITCPNKWLFLLGFVALFYSWIYLPVGLVEMLAGVSIHLPFGRRRPGQPARAAYIVSPRAVEAGALRLGVTLALFAAALVAAYW